MARFRETQLRKWRHYAGMTVVEAGRVAGRSHAQISRIELGHDPYSQPILEALAPAYGAGSPADLIDRPPPRLRTTPKRRK